jgi:aminoglycoside phosphotransferase (APT) family kinase protein
VPKVIVRGTDYILMENVHHQALQDGPHQGHAVGRALAEIHSVRFRAAGTIDGDLELDRQEPDPIAAMGARVPNGHSWTELRQAVASHLERHRQSLGPLIGRAVLLHGDFGVANLHQALDGVLVLDWELCRAGPALCDVGRLLRWGASQSFIDGFAQAYRAFGGELPDDFVTAAQLLDLVSLVEALEGAVAGSRRATDLQARIGQTLA